VGGCAGLLLPLPLVLLLWGVLRPEVPAETPTGMRISPMLDQEQRSRLMTYRHQLSPAHAMFAVICMTERWASSSAAERRRMAGITRRHRATARRWAGRCAENYEPMLAIVEAEIAGRAGKHDLAVTELERARKLATNSKLTWLLALASERLARLAARRGHTTLARAALDDARAAYSSWGAAAVVRRLERESDDPD
jgi:hypothetical protein